MKLTRHKIKRNINRKKWINICKFINNPKFNRPKYYEKLRKYENRKKSNSISNKVKSLREITIGNKLDFDANINSVFNLTKDINSLLKLSNLRTFRINHNKLNSISISGMIYLMAQISKISYAKHHDVNKKLNYNSKLGIKSNNLKLRYLMYKIGYWEFFGISKPYKIDKDIKDDYFLSVQSDTKDSFNLLNKIRDFVKLNTKILEEYEVEFKFDDAIKEAMGNSLEHAYPKNFDYKGRDKNRWWVCGYYDKNEQKIEIVFYDYGVGIRKSIGSNLDEKADIKFIDKMKDKYYNDADLLEIAATQELSKYKNYKEQDRGKGFKRFKDFAISSQFNCKLSIISGSGKYIYENLDNQEDSQKINLDNKIEGMLIKWQINLKKDEK